MVIKIPETGNSNLGIELNNKTKSLLAGAGFIKREMSEKTDSAVELSNQTKAMLVGIDVTDRVQKETKAKED